MFRGSRVNHPGGETGQSRVYQLFRRRLCVQMHPSRTLALIWPKKASFFIQLMQRAVFFILTLNVFFVLAYLHSHVTTGCSRLLTLTETISYDPERNPAAPTTLSFLHRKYPPSAPTENQQWEFEESWDSSCRTTTCKTTGDFANASK